MHSTKTETEIKKEISDYLKACGYKVYRMQAGRISKNMHNNEAGTPDLFCVGRHGNCFWVEVKTPTGKLRPAQVEHIADLIERGQFVLVASSIQEVAEYDRT